MAHYESVHQIKTLSELKSRLSPTRRCFIYTHSTMPYEPLVILHIALTNEISSNIKQLLKSHNESTKNYTNAIFYSINSCQKGLQQVDLGTALIKTCVRLLLDEMSTLTGFHTLSPIPKFKEWIDLKLSEALADFQAESHLRQHKHFDIECAFTIEDMTFLVEFFSTNNKANLFECIISYLKSSEFRNKMPHVELNDSTGHNSVERVLGTFLQRTCAFYLCSEKKNGYAFNPVCNFHLKNGAKIYRINFKADLSDNGWNASYGFMVNYGYYINELDSNCINYLINKEISISDSVKNSLDYFLKSV